MAMMLITGCLLLPWSHSHVARNTTPEHGFSEIAPFQLFVKPSLSNFSGPKGVIPTLECSIIIIGSARIYMLSRNTKGHYGFPPTSISSINVSLPLHPTGLKGRFMNWEYGVHGILGIPHVHILVARACQARLVTWIPSPLIAACP